MGCMWGVVGAANLCYIGQSHVKDWGSTPPQVISVFKICVIANKISTIQNLCVFVVHILLLV
jgi:hypothetical protein